MPQERDNPYPFPTAEEVEAAPGTREEKSARFVICRYITGIPSRGYLLGECDHAPIYQGVRDLTTAAWRLLDELAGPAPHNRNASEAEKALREILTTHNARS